MGWCDVRDWLIADVRTVLDAALTAAREHGIDVSVAVVDEGRELAGFLRCPGAVLASIDLAIAKAYTARSINGSTADLRPAVQPGEALYGLELAHARPLVAIAGGRLLKKGEEIVGAIGVSGGTVDEDDAIAATAARAFEEAAGAGAVEVTSSQPGL